LSESSINQFRENFSYTPVFSDIARKVVLGLLKNISCGSLVIEEDGKQEIFGERNSAKALQAHIVVHDPRAYAMVMQDGDLGAGEAYMQGYWTSPQLLSVVRIFVSNMQALEKMNTRRSWWRKLADTFIHWSKRNSQEKARQNIAAHYDLNNDFFKLFLDDTMAYSAGIFLSDDQSLLQASLQKFKHICDRLQLNANDHLLEIGTGWGGLAIYAAKQYGCRVTTTTLSQEQYDYALAWIQRENLQDQVTLLLKDYRELEGSYDKLVSIEMIEAVGAQYYPQYFSKCNELLKDDGLMLIQAITISDQRYQKSIHSMDFIKRYIFPGGQLPSNSVICKHISEDTDMQLIGLEDITLDYAQTLKYWRQHFFEKLDKVKQQGFSETFIRMWEYYLCFCEGGFRERVIHTGQFLIAKPQFRTLPKINVEA
jgi:cyclopropane-fatty-acyl-phospholipid synthase